MCGEMFLRGLFFEKSSLLRCKILLFDFLMTELFSDRLALEVLKQVPGWEAFLER